jgi:hypothetical protein
MWPTGSKRRRTAVSVMLARNDTARGPFSIVAESGRPACQDGCTHGSAMPEATA